MFFTAHRVRRTFVKIKRQMVIERYCYVIAQEYEPLPRHSTLSMACLPLPRYVCGIHTLYEPAPGTLNKTGTGNSASYRLAYADFRSGA